MADKSTVQDSGPATQIFPQNALYFVQVASVPWEMSIRQDILEGH